MEIKVRTLTGEETKIEIDPMETIAKIKERVGEKEGIPPLQDRIIYKGKLLADNHTAKHYGLERGSVLHRVSSLRGGF